MMSSKQNQLDATFAALADPTRREILRRLAGGGQTVGELAEPFDMSLPAVSKHLKALERAGLVSRSVDGRTHTLQLEAAPMREAAQWLGSYQRFWGGALDSLERFLDSSASKPAKRRPRKKT